MEHLVLFTFTSTFGWSNSQQMRLPISIDCSRTKRHCYALSFIGEIIHKHMHTQLLGIRFYLAFIFSDNIIKFNKRNERMYQLNIAPCYKLNVLSGHGTSCCVCTNEQIWFARTTYRITDFQYDTSAQRRIAVHGLISFNLIIVGCPQYNLSLILILHIRHSHWHEDDFRADAEQLTQLIHVNPSDFRSTKCRQTSKSFALLSSPS